LPVSFQYPFQLELTVIKGMAGCHGDFDPEYSGRSNPVAVSKTCLIGAIAR